jgi:hypothetical protein
MAAGPVRRGVATLGLLALVPTAALLASGGLTLEDAAMRAAITLAAVILLAKIVSFALRAVADRAGRMARAQALARIEGQRQSAVSAASGAVGPNTDSA